MGDAKTVMERCERLGNISEEGNALTRPYGSGAMREANDTVSGWMREAGMTVRRDAIGNLIGRYKGTGEKVLILGSHLDTVRDAGKYDGPLGILVAIACVRQLHDRDERLPFSVEVVAFADEEGLRFGTSFLGSSAHAGASGENSLELEDTDGVTLAQAIRDFDGDPEALKEGTRNDTDFLGYFEVHIEQGPVLEEKDAAVGIVTAISGRSSVRVGFTGEAGHAGTLPMGARRDALCAAAQFVLEVEAAGEVQPGAVATVGEISAFPGASNVVPGEVRLSLDLRHAEDAARIALRDYFAQKAEEIAVSRGCEVSWEARHGTPAVRMDPQLSGLLGEAVEENGVELYRLPSGAGHDAVAMAELAPVAMLFVRCEKGISHNPAEAVRQEDVGTAIEVTGRFLRRMADEVEPDPG